MSASRRPGSWFLSLDRGPASTGTRVSGSCSTSCCWFPTLSVWRGVGVCAPNLGLHGAASAGGLTSSPVIQGASPAPARGATAAAKGQRAFIPERKVDISGCQIVSVLCPAFGRTEFWKISPTRSAVLGGSTVHPGSPTALLTAKATVLLGFGSGGVFQGTEPGLHQRPADRGRRPGLGSGEGHGGPVPGPGPGQVPAESWVLPAQPQGHFFLFPSVFLPINTCARPETQRT